MCLYVYVYNTLLKSHFLSSFISPYFSGTREIGEDPPASTSSVLLLASISLASTGLDTFSQISISKQGPSWRTPSASLTLTALQKDSFRRTQTDLLLIGNIFMPHDMYLGRPQVALCRPHWCRLRVSQAWVAKCTKVWKSKHVCSPGTFLFWGHCLFFT